MLKISLSVLTIAAATFGLRPEPPVVGPGSVLATMRKASAALDSGDADVLAACFDVGRTPHVWVEDGDGKGRMASGPDSYALAAVGADGKAFEATSLEAFAQNATLRIGAVEGRAVETKLVSVMADCASAECSFAVADVERTYEGKGKATIRRVKITALMRYDNEANGFRVFHWHESLRE
jgi:hypothetical protein